jgi:MSHA biogenesis protein MshP
MFPERQRGIGLIAAIFLIVVVASLAVGVASLVRSGAAGYVQDVLAYKAFLAADSGAQLSLNRCLRPKARRAAAIGCSRSANPDWKDAKRRYPAA